MTAIRVQFPVDILDSAFNDIFKLANGSVDEAGINMLGNAPSIDLELSRRDGVVSQRGVDELYTCQLAGKKINSFHRTRS